VARVAIRVTIDFMLSFLFGWSRNFYPYIYNAGSAGVVDTIWLT